jgi:hypothetical protein
MGPRTRRERGLRPGSPSPPSLPPKEKQAYVRALVKRLKRAAEPIHLKFDVSTLDGVLALQKEVIQLVFDRKLDSADARSLNEAIRNLLGVMKPSELEAKIDALANQFRARGEILDSLQRDAKAAEHPRRSGKAEAN